MLLENQSTKIQPESLIQESKKEELLKKYQERVNQIIACNDQDTDALQNISQSYASRPNDFKQIEDDFFELPSKKIDELMALYIETQSKKEGFCLNKEIKGLEGKEDPVINTNFIERSQNFQDEIATKLDQLTLKKNAETKKKLFECYDITPENQTSLASTDYDENLVRENAMKFMQALQEKKDSEKWLESENQMVNDFDKKLNFKPKYTKKEDRKTIINKI